MRCPPQAGLSTRGCVGGQPSRHARGLLNAPCGIFPVVAPYNDPDRPLNLVAVKELKLSYHNRMCGT